jgi:magnesium chelatase family protein
METGRTTISRVLAHVTYPARFQCVAAMNPCRCGHLGEAGRECGRAPRCGEDYQGKLSGPLLDRMDLTIEVTPVPPSELARAPMGETSAQVAARVQAARALQRARFGAAGPACNAEAAYRDLQEALEPEAARLLESAATRLNLSTRGQVRSLRVARSIADLAASPAVRRAHVAEALAFRHRMPGRNAA